MPKEMLLIKDIDILHISGDTARVVDFGEASTGLQMIPMDASPCYLNEEYVRAQKYIFYGQEQYIGMTKKVRDILGLPLMAEEEPWRDIKRLRELYQKSLSDHHRMVKWFRNIPWWKWVWVSIMKSDLEDAFFWDTHK